MQVHNVQLYIAELTRVAPYKSDTVFSFHYAFKLVTIVQPGVTKVCTRWQAIDVHIFLGVRNLPILLSGSMV